MKSAYKLLFLSLVACGALAQSSITSSGEEEAVYLDKFVISGSNATGKYHSANTETNIVDGAPVGSRPECPVTIIKKADAVVVQIVLSNGADEQAVRNKELYEAVQAIERAVAAVKTLRSEQREIRFVSGNRKMISFGRGQQWSHATLMIFSELSPDLRLADRTKQIRDLIERIKLPGNTKVTDGYIGLYLKQPSSHRREILQKIFEDIDFVKKGLGNDYEVLPSGMNEPVNMRAVSETEIELWIDYSFTIQSVRALTNPKK